MNRLISVSCFLGLTAFVLLAQGPRGGPGRAMGRGMEGPQALVAGAPYSATRIEQSQETLADGNTITRTHQANVYRDSQGRMRTEETITPSAASGKQPYTVATILDFVGGHRYVLDSSTMTAFESPLRTPRAAAATGTGTPGSGRTRAANAPARPNVVRTDLAPQSINGVLASGTQHTETIPAGAIGNTQAIQTSRVMWTSTLLKVPVQIKTSDPRFGSSDMELTNIVQTEPSPALFTVPSGYTVKTGRDGRGPGAMRGPGPGGPGFRPF